MESALENASRRANGDRSKAARRLRSSMSLPPCMTCFSRSAFSRARRVASASRAAMRSLSDARVFRRASCSASFWFAASRSAWRRATSALVEVAAGATVGVACWGATVLALWAAASMANACMKALGSSDCSPVGESSDAPRAFRAATRRASVEYGMYLSVLTMLGAMRPLSAYPSGTMKATTSLRVALLCDWSLRLAAGTSDSSTTSSAP